MSAGKRWSEQEVEALRSWWASNKSARVIAKTLGRSLQSVYVKANKLGLPQKEQPYKIKLSAWDRLWLIRNYPHVRTEICAIRLGISTRSCVRLARRLGLEKTKQFMRETQAYTAKKAKESHLANGTYPPKGVVNGNIAKGESYRFKPGHTKNRQSSNQ